MPSTPPAETEPSGAGTNFIRETVAADIAAGRRTEAVTRFPPEPNGYLHIGHAKSIHLNFGLSRDFGGRCHLRFDDTNPETEDPEYVEAIKRDVRWLGFDWGEHEYYASDYFEPLYDWAVELIRAGRAYVDDQDEDAIREARGTVTEPGRPSPFRDRSIEENLDLFRRMREGDFPDGSRVLRAKIDMGSPNMKLRDPLMYRIRHAHHYRRGDTWCLYPFYDWAHGQSDAIEGISHSICTLEFVSNRPLYDWFLEQLGISPRPHQYEFARLALDYTVMSKRKLLRLVEEGSVTGWDDPRLATVSGLRRRGVTPEAIADFVDRIGVSKADSRVDYSLLEYSIRNDLNFRSPRVMAVSEPLRLIVTNYPDDKTEWLEASYWPHDVPREGTRKIPFTKELWIERSDFMEDPPPKYHRLAPGREVRLRYGYLVTCQRAIRSENGDVIAVECTYDPATRGGDAPDGRKVRGTMHWVSVPHAVPAEIRLYDRLFSVADPEADDADYTEHLNPDSLQVVNGFVEPSVADDSADTRYQFERLGYFWRDPEDATRDRLVFNRIVSLRDSWSRRAAVAEHGPVAAAVDAGRAPESSEGKAEPPVEAVGGAPPLRDVGPEHAADLATLRTAGVPEAESRVLVTEPDLLALYRAALEAADAPAALARFIVNDFAGSADRPSWTTLPFSSRELGVLVRMTEGDLLSSSAARTALTDMLEHGRPAADTVAALGLQQVSDDKALEEAIRSAIAAHPDRVEAFRGGKTGLLGFFVGQVMRATGGAAHPQRTRELLESALSEPE